MRLGPVVGRKKQMIKYKGTTLYPPAMYNILNDFSEIESYVIEIFHNELGTDEILIKIASAAISEELLKTEEFLVIGSVRKKDDAKHIKSKKRSQRQCDHREYKKTCFEKVFVDLGKVLIF